MKKFLFLLLVPLCLLFGCTPAAENSLAATEGDVRILFINVGKADAALLMTGEKNYLIDTGTEDSAGKLLTVLSSASGFTGRCVSLPYPQGPHRRTGADLR